MNKHLDKIWPQMLQNKASSAVWGPYFGSYVCLVCGGWDCKKESPILQHTAQHFQRRASSCLILCCPCVGNLLSLKLPPLFRMRLGCGSKAARLWLGCGSDVARMWRGRGLDVFSDVVQTVWQKLRERGLQHAHVLLLTSDVLFPCRSQVKIRSKSLEIMCLQRYKAYPDRAEK